MKTFVIGNIQGHYDQLMQCLDTSKFDYEEDRLIVLGNVSGYGPNTAECAEELLKIKKRIILAAGHDDWFRNWLSTGIHADNWQCGGVMTLLSYLRNAKKDTKIVALNGKLTHNLRPEDVPESHWYFYMKRNYLYPDQEKRLFVSSGIDPSKTIEENIKNTPLLYWDKTLWHKLAIQKIEVKFVQNFKEVYVSDYGVYESLRVDHPVNIGIVWNIGTSFRNAGRLTLLNVDTKEYYQSDEINVKHCTFL